MPELLVSADLTRAGFLVIVSLFLMVTEQVIIESLFYFRLEFLRLLRFK